MRALVTGGAGFIGSHLCERLLKEGYEVTVIDDLSTGDKNNLKNCFTFSSFHFYISDILSSVELFDLVYDCDVIFHFAAVVGVKKVLDSHVDTLIAANINSTERLIYYSKMYKKKIIFASTSEVYGKNTDIPFSENSDSVFGSVDQKRWIYAYTKILDEIMLLEHHSMKNFPVVIVRLFNTIGPRQKGCYGMVVPNFMQNALKDEPITIFGSGEQTRCFVDVLDVVDGIFKLSVKPTAEGHVFNIGSYNEISINDLAEKIKVMENSNSEIKHIPYEKVYGGNLEDMQKRIPDLSKINKLIGYTPKISLYESLQPISRFYRS